jgi:hypothetical protein
MNTPADKPVMGSDTRRRAKRAAITGASLALFCVVFTFIYERFSHNAVSTHMRCMFLMPLLGVALPAVIGYLTPLHPFPGRAAFNLWNSAMAVWTVGCLFRGIVNISGRYTSLDRPYMVAGWVFIALVVMAETVRLITRHKHERRKTEC